MPQLGIRVIGDRASDKHASNIPNKNPVIDTISEKQIFSIFRNVPGEKAAIHLLNPTPIVAVAENFNPIGTGISDTRMNRGSKSKYIGSQFFVMWVIYGNPNMATRK